MLDTKCILSILCIYNIFYIPLFILEHITGEMRKRKIIELDDNTFKILSIKAAQEGTNLKALIEKSLDELAENIQDSELYTYLLRNYQEGKEMLGSKEKEEFENWLGL